MLDGLRLALIRRLEKLNGQSTPPTPPLIDLAKVDRLRAQGNALIAEEKFDEAETCFRNALAFKEDDTRLLVCLGYVLKEQNRFAEARIALRRAANPGNTDPQAFEAHYLLGEISQAQSDLEDAKRHFTSALDLKPDFMQACNDVLRILHLQGRQSESRAFMAALVKRCPDNADFHLMMAELYTNALMFQGTLDHLMAAIALGINEVRIHMLLGAVLCKLEREEEARKYFEMAEMADPTVAFDTHFHLGYLHTRRGNSKLAVEFLEKSIELQPDFVPSHSLLLINLSHAAVELNKSYRAAAEQFAQKIESATSPLPPLTEWLVADESKVLRVGFVSGEFREHPVYHFLIGILEQMDKSLFQLVAFSNNPVDDSCTAEFRALFVEWHEIKQLSDDGVADLVRAQRIDVLVDLSGHTGETRLPAFAKRPALVQVAWLGYFASTGLTSMDYIIADEVCVPDDSHEWFSEKLVRLPKTRLCMTIPRTSRPIPVTQAPCATKGYVTFGSFQQAAKINRQVLLAWASVMASVPQSRLRIQNKAIDSAAIAQKLREDMAQAGMDLSRVDLIGATDWEEYLEAHREIDVLLDTFPYTGGTTTAFALWMGVPTVTLAGSTMLSLQGASMLTCVGLTDWIATSEVNYVEIAQQVAGDRDALVQLRQQLRSISEKSPLFDCERFAMHLEEAIRFMYREKLVTLMPLQTGEQLH